MTVVLEGQRHVELGSTISAYVEPDKVHVFNAEGNAIT
jgi:multiple sugar transport system ATP-binding protein